MSLNHNYFDMDLTAPDLLPIDDLITDLTCPKDPELVVLKQEIFNLNAKMERLILDSNTQALRVEIERVKRRKLQSSLKQIRGQLLTPCPEIETLKREINERHCYQEAIHYQFDGELTSLRTIMFRGLARMHEALVYLLPHVMLPPGSGHELSIMLDEVSRTIRQFHAYLDVTYV